MGITYEPNGVLLEIALEGLDHLTLYPSEIKTRLYA
jgi:hypothetical protein